MKILITGTAGFIGSHTVFRMLEMGHEIVGLDSINDYYDMGIKFGRLKEAGITRQSAESETISPSKSFPGYRFIRANLEKKETVDNLFEREQFDGVIHLAAQAGVRYSITNPYAYIEANIIGFQNILEACRNHKVKHLVYASSSSVYGLIENYPFSTRDNVDHPVSLYAATKKSNELMAHAYSHLYRIPTTGLRFFTVYGPWGRPDMAYFLFTKAILEDRPINVFNNGHMKRDFTYIDDIVNGIAKVLLHPPAGNPFWSGKEPDPSSSPAPYKIYNIGNNSPVYLMEFIEAIENALGKKAVKHFLPMQDGDVSETWANIDDLSEELGYSPSIGVEEGIDRFVKWYRKYFGV